MGRYVGGSLVVWRQLNSLVWSTALKCEYNIMAVERSQVVQLLISLIQSNNNRLRSLEVVCLPKLEIHMLLLLPHRVRIFVSK